MVVRHSPPPLAASLSATLARLAAIWCCPWLSQVTVTFVEPRRASLGSSNSNLRSIRLDVRLRRRPALLAEAVCHEAAHLVSFDRSRGKGRPHGPEWRSLVRAAGFEARIRLPRLGADATPLRPPRRAHRFEHSCPVCHATRFAARRMSAWRCANCVLNGLEGLLEIRRIVAEGSQ